MANSISLLQLRQGFLFVATLKVNSEVLYDEVNSYHGKFQPSCMKFSKIFRI